MAINFTRLFTKVGHLLGGFNEVNTYRGSTLQSRVTTVIGDYSVQGPELITGIYDQRDNLETAFSGWLSYTGSLMGNSIIDEVVADRPLANPSLTNCLDELRRQMVVAGESLNHSLCTIGSVTVVGSPTTDPVFVTTSKDGSGVATDLIIPDSYLLTVVADSQRGATKYQEQIRIVGKPTDSAPTDFTYPTGSGVDTTTTLLDPAISNGLVQNCDFNNFTVTNVPDNWTIVAPAVAGTNVFKVGDDPRLGASGSALRLVTTAAATYKVRQAVTLQPNTVYAAKFSYKPVANAGGTTSTIVAVLRLVDGSGTVITDDASTSNSISGRTHAVGTVGSGWYAQNKGVFITPKTLPAATYLEITFTSDATGAEGYVDHVNMVAVQPLYTGGPRLTMWSGHAAGVYQDAWTWAITLTTGAVSDYIIRGLDRFLGLRTLSFRIPTSGSATQADALIA